MNTLFDSVLALMFTTVTNLLYYVGIVLTTGQFIGSIKGPSSVLSRNRCYKLHPLLATLLISMEKEAEK